MSDPGEDKTRSDVILGAGTRVGDYRIVEKIGAGGMGEIYLAEDLRLQRRVAMKFLPEGIAANPAVQARFMREAQAVAQLNHPNVVAIYDVNEFEGRPYFVMEHIEGVSLHHFAHTEPLPVDDIVGYAIQICQGLAEAHRAGIVHRDVKAANIAIDRSGRVRLLDFGLAAMAGDEKLTRTGSTLGTVAYMSPEQVTGRDVDHRSDLFSLGVVLYELITGRTPFKRDSEGATLKAIIEDDPEPLARFKASVPEDLQRIVSKLLDKDRELRYQSAEGVIADLKRLVYDSQQSAIVRKTAPPRRKPRLLFASLALVVLVAVALGAYLLRPEGSSDPPDASVPMIAVMPFENLGPAEDEYFADGMTEEITSRLAGIKGLGVISGTSAMQYRSSSKSPTEIGKELGVNYLVEGSVRWSRVDGKTRVRITPQLVRVSDDRHIWADNYERELMEVFTVQADIAEKIVDQLGLNLVERERQDLAARPTENPEAYELYLRGLNGVRLVELGDFSDLMIAKTSLDSAVALDPDFALAHAMRSIVYSRLVFGSDLAGDPRIAKEEALTALRLQADLSFAHEALGIYYNLVETDYERALEEYRLAQTELHNDASLLANIALVQLRQGRFVESQKNFRRAAELDPVNPARHWMLANSLAMTRSWDDAEHALDNAISIDPTRAAFRRDKQWLYMSRDGRWDKVEPLVREALAHVDTLEFVSENFQLAPHMPELDWPRLLEAVRTGLRDKMDVAEYYSDLVQGYFVLGNQEMVALYADSSRLALEEHLERNPKDAEATSALGLALTYLGDCEGGIEQGLKGKEMLSVDTCHW